MPKKYLFVSGCPRSGTTVLTSILNWSDQAFVGQERYAGLMNRKPAQFLPIIFNYPRLLQFERGDCGYSSFEEKNEYNAWFANPKNFAKLDRMEYIGDKITNLYCFTNVFSTPPWAIRNVTILHIIRNIQDVAASYQTRKQDAKDAWSKDYLQAVADWTESVERIHDFAGKVPSHIRLGIINYDAIFSGDIDTLMHSARKIYDFVGLTFGAKQEQGITKIFSAGEQRKEARQKHDDIRRDVESRIAGDVFTKYAELAAQALC